MSTTAPSPSTPAPRTGNSAHPPDPPRRPRTLRVAMTIGSFRPVLGGAQLQLEHLGPLLADRGIEVSVLTRRSDRSRPRRATEGTLDVVRLPAPRPRAVSSVAFTATGAAWIAATRPDVVHAHGLLSPATAALVGCAISGRPLVAKVLAAGPHGDLARLHRKAGGDARWRWLRRSVAAFVCVSADVEEELLAAGVDPSRLARIPNGVDLGHHCDPVEPDVPLAARRAALDLPPDGPLTIACGRLDATKRLEVLVGAMTRFPGTVLLLGDGPERARLASVARRAGVAERLILRPTVEDPAPYLAVADVYASCSEQDGLSNAVLEAMAGGLPVVATLAGGARELVDTGTGILVPVPDEGAVGEAVAALLTDPARARALGAAGRRRVEDGYALQATAEKLVALYRRVAA